MERGPRGNTPTTGGLATIVVLLLLVRARDCFLLVLLSHHLAVCETVTEEEKQGNIASHLSQASDPASKTWDRGMFLSERSGPGRQDTTASCKCALALPSPMQAC